MKAEKHYQEWSLEECRTYFKMYLDLVKRRDVKEVRKELAEFFGRTYSSIGFKEREVVGVLTEGQEGIYTYGENMVIATNEALKASGMSVTRFKMLFE